jgi:hypothetical protein
MSAAKAAAIAVLADANILVKDVVSNVLYDLHAAGIIALHWTSEIEAEAVEHRARLRADKQSRPVELQDLAWASARLDVITTYLVKHPNPQGWVNLNTLNAMKADSTYAALSAVPDPDDLHVAMAAAHLAKVQGTAIVLATDNLKDLPPKILKPFQVVVMHQGDLLEYLYQRDPKAVSASLLKTMGDFKSPQFTHDMMLVSIRSRNQFGNPDLADKLALVWAVAPAAVTATAKPAAVRQRARKGPGLKP